MISRDNQLSRRQLLAGLGAAAVNTKLLSATPAPTAPVAIARCKEYGTQFYNSLETMLDQIGGIGPMVQGKTVALKLNLTGNPERYPERPDMPYRNHPDTVLATATLLAKAGAHRIRIIESFFPGGQDMALWGRYGLDIDAINNVGCVVEWENTNVVGKSKQYRRLKVVHGGYIFSQFDLNHSYHDCDAFVSLSKLKNHWIAGVTMALKNNFGLTPCSLYGGDAYPDGTDDPKQERGKVCHAGEGKPAKGAPQELDLSTPREPGYRVPRIVTDLVSARPIDLSIVDGVISIRGGEGVWNKGVQMVEPGVVLAGKNPVCTDAVSTAVMGYDPRAERGTKPFIRGDNTMLLAEAAGIGSADLSRIEVVGDSIKDAMYDYGPGPIGETI